MPHSVDYFIVVIDLQLYTPFNGMAMFLCVLNQSLSFLFIFLISDHVAVDVTCPLL